MIDAPKTHWTLYKKCGKHQPPLSDTVQEGQRLPACLGRWVMVRNSAYGGQSRPISLRRLKTTKTVELRLEGAGPSCRSKRMLVMKTTSEQR